MADKNLWKGAERKEDLEYAIAISGLNLDDGSIEFDGVLKRLLGEGSNVYSIGLSQGHSIEIKNLPKKCELTLIDSNGNRVIAYQHYFKMHKGILKMHSSVPEISNPGYALINIGRLSRGLPFARDIRY